MRSGETIRADIERRLRFFPALLEPAMATPAVLEGLWAHMQSGCLDNPLPLLFKERLLAYLSRYCGAPYCIVSHSCALHSLGMNGREVLEWLRQHRCAAAVAEACPDAPPAALRQPLAEFPSAGSRAETAVFAAAVAVFQGREGADACRIALRLALPQDLYGHLIALLGWAKAWHLWAEAHPEVSCETDRRVQEHLAALSDEEPALVEFFHSYAREARRECVGREARLVAEIAQRDQVEQAIRDSEDRFRRAVVHAPFPVMIYADDGQVVQINDTWCELSGYVPSDIPKVCDWMRKAEGRDEEWEKEDVDALFEWDGRVEEGEYVITTRDGGQRTWEFISAPLGRLADGRRAVLRMAVDVTEHKRLEQALWEANHRMASILESITDGFFAVDKQWRLVYINRRAEELIRRDRGEVINKNLWQELPHDAEPGLRQEFQRAMDNSTPIHSEAYYLPLDIWFEYHAYPSPDGISVYFRDVSERRRMEEALRRANQYLHALLRASPLPILAMDADGTIRTWNPAAQCIFGWSEEEVVGRPNPLILPERQVYFQRNLALMLRGEVIASQEVLCRRKDGVVVRAHLSLAPIRNGERISSIMAIFVPIAG